VPRISAATVPEHRAKQRRALIDAARSLLAESGEQAPSLADVAERAGLSRPSVYQYFRSRDDLLDAVIEDTIPRWSARFSDAMTSTTDPAERILRYVSVNLALVDEGEHALARALAASASGAALAERSAAMHANLRAPLLAALTELGVEDPAVTADLVGSLVYSASVMVEAGTDVAVAERNVVALLTPYLELRGRAASRRPPGSSRR
jgi:AcrR family transcriptional regulator